MKKKLFVLAAIALLAVVLIVTAGVHADSLLEDLKVEESKIVYGDTSAADGISLMEKVNFSGNHLLTFQWGYDGGKFTSTGKAEKFDDYIRTKGHISSCGSIMAYPVMSNRFIDNIVQHPPVVSGDDDLNGEIIKYISEAPEDSVSVYEVKKSEMFKAQPLGWNPFTSSDSEYSWYNLTGKDSIYEYFNLPMLEDDALFITVAKRGNNCDYEISENNFSAWQNNDMEVGSFNNFTSYTDEELLAERNTGESVIGSSEPWDARYMLYPDSETNAFYANSNTYMFVAIDDFFVNKDVVKAGKKMDRDYVSKSGIHVFPIETTTPADNEFARKEIVAGKGSEVCRFDADENVICSRLSDDEKKAYFFTASNEEFGLYVVNLETGKLVDTIKTGIDKELADGPDFDCYDINLIEKADSMLLTFSSGQMYLIKKEIPCVTVDGTGEGNKGAVGESDNSADAGSKAGLGDLPEVKYSFAGRMRSKVKGCSSTLPNDGFVDYDYDSEKDKLAVFIGHNIANPENRGLDDDQVFLYHGALVVFEKSEMTFAGLYKFNVDDMVGGKYRELNGDEYNYDYTFLDRHLQIFNDPDRYGTWHEIHMDK